MNDLFETIVEKVPAPQVDQDAPFLMQVSTLAWSDYIGRIGCGRVLAGGLKVGDELQRITTRHLEVGDPDAGWEITGTQTARVTHLWVTRGLENREVDEVVGRRHRLARRPRRHHASATRWPRRSWSRPPRPCRRSRSKSRRSRMFFLVNNGPFAGQDGRAVTLRQIKDRLERELRVNVALRVEDLGRPDGVKVCGRGELHLAILIEEMRREGMELCVSRPEVITHRDAKGKLLEPMEQLIIDVPEEYQGAIIQELSLRKGELVAVESTGTGLVRLEFTISTRGLIGYRNDFLTETRGLGVMSSRFTGYGPWKGELPGRERGSLVSQTGGEAAGYSLENLQQRATLFVGNMTPVYEGMIVGENSRADDMLCNPTKRKQLGNYRSSTKEIDAGLKVPRPHHPRERPGVDRRRRARRGDAQDRARAQAHPQHRAAQEVREARGGRGLTRRRAGRALPPPGRAALHSSPPRVLITAALTDLAVVADSCRSMPSTCVSSGVSIALMISAADVDAVARPARPRPPASSAPESLLDRPCRRRRADAERLTPLLPPSRRDCGRLRRPASTARGARRRTSW